MVVNASVKRSANTIVSQKAYIIAILSLSTKYFGNSTHMQQNLDTSLAISGCTSLLVTHACPCKCSPSIALMLSAPHQALKKGQICALEGPILLTSSQSRVVSLFQERSR